MASTSARMLRLLSLLQSGRPWSAADLAGALGASPRTLRRDIDRLRELGYPVESLRGPGGHYRLVAGSALPPLMLEDDEAVAVALGLRLVAAGGVGSADAHGAAERASAKLARVLPARLARTVDAVNTSVESEPDAWAGPDRAVVARLASAARHRRVVAFRYRSRSGEESHRRVDPYRIVRLRRRWYLFGWDRERGDWRSYRLDRVAEVAGSTLAFSPRALPDADVVGWLDRSFSAAAPRLEVVVRFDAPADRVAERLVRVDGVLEAVGDARCRYRARVDSHEWLAAVLAVSGLDFAVESPADFAAYVAAAGERLARAGRRGAAGSA